MKFKNFLIVSVALLLLVGIFFAGAVFGSRYQLEQRYGDLTDTTDTEETTTQDTTTQEPEEIYPLGDDGYYDTEYLIYILENQFDENGEPVYSEYEDLFPYVNIRPDGKGIAQSLGMPVSMHHAWSRLFRTSDYGKTWEYVEGVNLGRSHSRTIAYVGDTIINMGLDYVYDCYLISTYSDHGDTPEKDFVFPSELLGYTEDSDVGRNVSLHIVSENYDTSTVVIGFSPLENDDENNIYYDKEYFYIAEYDTDLNLVKEIYKNQSVYDTYIK